MRTFVIAAALSLVGIGSAQALDCPQFIRMHGMASRAQFQCGFNQYNEAVIDQARTCARQIGEGKLKSNLMAGMKQFDSSERKIGHEAACRKILKDFPMVVRR